MGGFLLDEDQVRSVYAAHGGDLHRAARRSLGDDQLAEDAVQETFLRAWRTADRFADRLRIHRRVLVEVHLRDGPIAEVAAELSIPVGTVKSRAY